jgi:hypothetical protein
MNEYSYVEFFCPYDTEHRVLAALTELGDDFVMQTLGAPFDRYGLSKITGKIATEQASMLMLKGGILSMYMHMSGIPDSIKDMYRKINNG